MEAVQQDINGILVIGALLVFAVLVWAWKVELSE